MNGIQTQALEAQGRRCDTLHLPAIMLGWPFLKIYESFLKIYECFREVATLEVDWMWKFSPREFDAFWGNVPRNGWKSIFVQFQMLMSQMVHFPLFFCSWNLRAKDRSFFKSLAFLLTLNFGRQAKVVHIFGLVKDQHLQLQIGTAFVKACGFHGANYLPPPELWLVNLPTPNVPPSPPETRVYKPLRMPLFLETDRFTGHYHELRGIWITLR